MLIKIGRFLLSLTLLLFAVAVHAQVPTASISCPATALVGEPVICDGSASTNVNGQLGWSTKTFVDGTAPVAWDFGDNLGPYSKAELLKATHVYLSPGTYQVTLTVKNAAGNSASAAPQVITVSAIPAATGGAIQVLTNQGSPSANMAALQTKVNTAFAANTIPQEIQIANGLQLTGQLTLPAAVGNNYVTLRPVDISWLPSGLQRVTPALASNMPKFTAPFGNGSPIQISGVGRKYLRVLGIEFNKPQDLIMSSLILIGSDGNAPTAYNQLPDHIMFDRCYFHGNPTDDTTRGFLVYGNDISIINSYFKDFHDPGADSQTVVLIEGKRFGYVNNYAEAYGENIMLGGAGTNIRFSATASGGTSTSATLSSVASLNVGDGISFMVGGNRGPWSASIVRSISGNNITFDPITNQAGTPSAPDTTSNAVKYGSSPQDIFVARNYFYKDTAFRVGAPNYNGHYTVVKNSFELKHGMRVIAVGNVIENHWGNQGQDGHTVLFTPRNQTCFLQTFPHDPVTCPEQVNPWVTVRDVQFSHTRVKNIPDFFNILGTDNLNPPGTGDESGPTGYAQNITVREVLIDGADPGHSGAGQLAFIWPCARNITFSHNTQTNVTGGPWIISSDAACTSIQNAVIVNNIGPYQDYGLIGDGLQGNDFIAHFFPGGFVRYNVLTDDRNGKDGTPFSAPQGGPNYFPATIDSGIFVNRAAGDYHISPTSPFRAGGATPAADGSSMGANFDEVTAATLNTISGDWSGVVVGSGDFVTDTFTEASDTTLASHTGEVGATWTLHPSYSGAALDNGSLKRVYLNTSATAAYYASGVPSGANYCVQADFNRVTQISNNISIVIGMDTAADAGLLLRGNDNGSTFQWEVIDRAGGSNTLLTSSSANQPAIGGAAVTMKMCRNGTSVTVFANGVQNTALNATTTTTAVGKAGIRASGQATSTTGIHLDNFHAQ